MWTKVHLKIKIFSKLLIGRRSFSSLNALTFLTTERLTVVKRQMRRLRKRLSKPFIGLIPLGRVLERKVAKAIATWSTDKALEWWKNSSEQRQVKKFINEYTPKFTQDLLNKGSRTVQILPDGKRNFTAQCKELARLKLEWIGKPYWDTVSYIKITQSKLEELIKKASLAT